MGFQLLEETSHVKEDPFHFLVEINQNQNHLCGGDRIFGKALIKEPCFVEHVRRLLDVALNLVDKVQAIVELVDRHNVGFLLPIKLLLQRVDLLLQLLAFSLQVDDGLLMW